MFASSPITRQTVGRTFMVAISLLGAIAATQIGVIAWAFATRKHVPTTITIVKGLAPDGTPNTIEREDADFNADPLSTAESRSVAEAAHAGKPAAAEAEKLAMAKPTLLTTRLPTPGATGESARFSEALDFGKRERERGDTSAALNRFLEAERMNPTSPEPLYEQAITYEKMSLPVKAAELWNRIYDMGETAGPYYKLAEARRQEAKQATMAQAAPSAPADAQAEEGIAPGKSLGLLAISVEEKEDKASLKKLAVRIPIKARKSVKVDVRSLTIQVLFYDTVGNQNLVQTTANVSSRWDAAPADWAEENLETLEVEYQLPLPDAKVARGENRKYFGYLVRIYYKGELQAVAGSPDRLLEQFPAEERLPEEKKDR